MLFLTKQKYHASKTFLELELQIRIFEKKKKEIHFLYNIYRCILKTNLYSLQSECNIFL